MRIKPLTFTDGHIRLNYLLDRVPLDKHGVVPSNRGQVISYETGERPKDCTSTFTDVDVDKIEAMRRRYGFSLR